MERRLYLKLLWQDGHRAVEMPEDFRPFFHFLTCGLGDLGDGSPRTAYDEALVCRRLGVEMGILPETPLHGKMVSYLHRVCEHYSCDSEMRKVVELALGELPANSRYVFHFPLLRQLLVATLLPFEETLDLRCPKHLRRIHAASSAEEHLACARCSTACTAAKKASARAGEANEAGERAVGRRRARTFFFQGIYLIISCAHGLFRGARECRVTDRRSGRAVAALSLCARAAAMRSPSAALSAAALRSFCIHARKPPSEEAARAPSACSASVSARCASLSVMRGRTETQALRK